ncbi:hypothetical protein RRG08_040592 [Elysia crispata]|uniref:Uncharacterized protein n=1 Tax=Elysia crispata TaxID=231223 RepID=A0AAE0YJI1_9GAST|nr:hypothetical protein RRG08_040592 [Elysia crispata]
MSIFVSKFTSKDLFVCRRILSSQDSTPGLYRTVLESDLHIHCILCLLFWLLSKAGRSSANSTLSCYRLAVGVRDIFGDRHMGGKFSLCAPKRKLILNMRLGASLRISLSYTFKVLATAELNKTIKPSIKLSTSLKAPAWFESHTEIHEYLGTQRQARVKSPSFDLGTNKLSITCLPTGLSDPLSWALRKTLYVQVVKRPGNDCLDQRKPCEAY